MGISMDSLPPRYQKQAARKLDPVAYEKALQFFHAEESAKNPARQAQGSISRATGEGFETQILTACAYYRAHGIAEIDKTPEPIKVISGRHQNPSGCWSFEAVFTKQAQPDFQGTLCGGSSVVFEARPRTKTASCKVRSRKSRRVHWNRTPIWARWRLCWCACAGAQCIVSCGRTGRT